MDGDAESEPTSASVAQQRARAIEALGRGGAAAALEEFARTQTTNEFRNSPAYDALVDALPRLRRAVASAGLINLSADGDATTLSFRGGTRLDVVFELESEPPHRIRSLTVVELSPGEAEPPVPQLTWDGLEAYFARAAESGFSGYVLARRDGRTILDRGFAPAELDAPRRDTVFDIGSYPLVFTQAAVILLAQQGRLELDHPLRRFFPDAPADKRDITLRQLLDGRSGLPNFHGDPTRDRDPDLSALSRAEALRRIFDAPLLFPPGSESSFSHSAYGLLAAVVEQVSGDSYREFLTRYLLRPAGLHRTGFYGDDLGLPPDAFAVGHVHAAATPNIPPNWGPTSWLILGSGGMVSTVPEIQRFHAWIHAGGLLHGEFLERFEKSHLAAGGTERGFLTIRGWDGADSEIVVAANPLPQWSDRQDLPAAIRELTSR